ncbi:biotin--[acetyl-CoA-carboxylase] ligase [uncultured Muribaculum sp.]|uniref:biotin--[acetyl-CoA-carboxylase] ligase n=1 Tax=uncultured Muribaculum sp. TaxID=1918613 RepID=UPI0025E68F16|nr:biotin--[acetyl-CoA-carboxylase] ligase [uncultured Muribaculum sp.]
MSSAITHIVRLDSVPSTSSYLATVTDALPHGAVVIAREQTAGRGQRGNSWEAEPGANLTFSLLLRPEGIRADKQFGLSEAVALGIASTLQRHLPDSEVRIKWPNDIYAGNRKICGILIENSLLGSEIRRSIAGIGINVNQTEWRSDAPNPVSMAQIAGHSFQLDGVLEDTVSAIMHEFSLPAADRHARYMELLWGRSGLTYRDSATGDVFRASIHSIAPDGMMTLAPSDGSPLRTYAFKEVAVIL